MISGKTLIRILGAVAVAGMATVDLQACVACFGQSDSAMARGMNMGIFTLLLVITCVLFTIAGFFVFLIRRNLNLTEMPQVTAPFSENRTNA